METGFGRPVFLLCHLALGEGAAYAWKSGVFTCRRPKCQHGECGGAPWELEMSVDSPGAAGQGRAWKSGSIPLLQPGAEQPGCSGAAAATLGIRHLPGYGDGPRPGKQPAGGDQDQAWWGCLHETSLSAAVPVIHPVWRKGTGQSLQTVGRKTKFWSSFFQGTGKDVTTLFTWSSSDFPSSLALLQKGGWKRGVDVELEKRADKRM